MKREEAGRKTGMEEATGEELGGAATTASQSALGFYRVKLWR